MTYDSHSGRFSRRNFILGGLSLSGLLVSSRFGLPAAHAATQTGATDAERGALGAAASRAPRILSIFLRGACDMDSVLFQADNAFYFDSRPNIAIGRKGLGDSVEEVAPGWGLHPAMGSLQPLLERREFAFLPFFGSGDNSRSHFEAQDVMERALLMPGPVAETRRTTDGFANRLLQQAQRRHPDARLGGFYTGSLNPVACRGTADMAYLELKNPVAANPQRDDRQLQALRQLYADPESSERVTLASRRKAEVKELLMGGSMGDDMQHGANSRTQVNLGTHFSRLADLMRQGGAYSVAFTDIGGWDTHVNQGNEVGLLANKLRELADALALFADRMGPTWKDTRVVVVSEFGRTFRENGNRGTDHGHATTVWLAGGRPFEKTVLGKTLRHSRDTLHEGRDLPILNGQDALMRVLLG